MDYHLDWIYASLVLNRGGLNQIHSNSQKIIHATLEDIDFLVAYEIQNSCHIIFLEAKGVTLFSNKQLQSKIKRLSAIFDTELLNKVGVIPHFAIVSPIQPQKIRYVDWPNWARPDGQVKWIRLSIINGLKKVVRCNQAGNADKKGEYWIAKPGEF